jgi:glutaredoxin
MALLLLLLSLLAGTGCSTPRQQGASIRIPREGTVVLFSRSGCPYCSQAREYLKTRNVHLDERDISTDRQALQELATLYEGKLKGERQLVPVLLVGDRVLVGFDEEELADALAAWQSKTQRGKGP